jgi:hypothetical protein
MRSSTCSASSSSTPPAAAVRLDAAENAISTTTDTAVSRPNVTTQPLLLPATDATIMPVMPPAHRTITTIRRTRSGISGSTACT